MRYLLLIFLVVIFGVLGYGYVKYLYVYSDGEREGLLNKFSTKGTLYKTNEGELLMPGVIQGQSQLSSNFFYFSSIDPTVTEVLKSATGKKVRVHYQQYKGNLPWRGDDYNDKNQEPGQYIVDKVEIVQ